MRILLLSILLLSGTARAWTPMQFAAGTFASGTMCVGSSVPTAAGPAAPADGYESSLYAYYNFEQTTSPATDLAHSRNLPQSCGAVSSGFLTGFSGNAYQINCRGGRGNPKVNLSRTDDGSGDFEFGGSFSVRFMVKTTVHDGLDFRNLVGESSWNVYLNVSGSSGKIDFFISGNDNPDVDLISNEDVNDGLWHRVICWFDATGIGTAGVQIDTNAPVTTTTVDIFVSPPSNSFFVGDDFGANQDVDFDELAIWSPYALTPEDRLFDWADGAVRTYPLP